MSMLFSTIPLFLLPVFLQYCIIVSLYDFSRLHFYVYYLSVKLTPRLLNELLKELAFMKSYILSLMLNNIGPPFQLLEVIFQLTRRKVSLPLTPIGQSIEQTTSKYTLLN